MSSLKRRHPRSSAFRSRQLQAHMECTSRGQHNILPLRLHGFAAGTIDIHKPEHIDARKLEAGKV